MKYVLHKDTVLIYWGGEAFYFVSLLKQTYFTSFTPNIVFCNYSYLRVRFGVTCQAVSCNRHYLSLPVMTVMGRNKKDRCALCQPSSPYLYFRVKEMMKTRMVFLIML